MANKSASGGLITETVASLTGGVSQQADAVRQPNQAKEILNCLLSPTEGLKKRPPSEIVQNLWPVFENFVLLTPFARTTTDAADGAQQVTQFTFPASVAPEGTKYIIKLDYWGTPLPSTHPFPVNTLSFYVVQAGDTLTDVVDGIAAAINEGAAALVNAANVADVLRIEALYEHMEIWYDIQYFPPTLTASSLSPGVFDAR